MVLCSHFVRGLVCRGTILNRERRPLRVIPKESNIDWRLRAIPKNHLCLPAASSKKIPVALIAKRKTNLRNIPPLLSGLGWRGDGAQNHNQGQSGDHFGGDLHYTPPALFATTWIPSLDALRLRIYTLSVPASTAFSPGTVVGSESPFQKPCHLTFTPLPNENRRSRHEPFLSGEAPWKPAARPSRTRRP